MISYRNSSLQKLLTILIVSIVGSIFFACQVEIPDPKDETKASTEPVVTVTGSETMTAPAKSTPSMSPDSDVVADVLSVKVTGNENEYRFSVEISSPDTGCDQYADWWEVLTEDGKLIYRRILAHSHSNEQPFTRSGGPVSIKTDTVVIVRAHMHPTGYGGRVMLGSVTNGFSKTVSEPDFAANLESKTPLPDDCAF